jgi:hypothetical protein
MVCQPFSHSHTNTFILSPALKQNAHSDELGLVRKDAESKSA